MAQLKDSLITGDLRVTGTIYGNATSANKLSTSRTISLTGAVTGSGSFDGSGNLSIATTKNHTHPVGEITWAGGQNLTPTASANGQEWSIDLNSGSYTDTYFHIWSTKNSKSILCCYPDDNRVTIPNGTLTVNGNITGNAGLEIKGHIAGDTGSSGHGLWSGGGYHNAYNNIILHGDASTGTSGIAFVSDKGSTTINQPSDRAFIQWHAHGVTTYTAESTAPTLATSGENNILVIGVGNDAGDQIRLQSPAINGLLHQVGATGYVIPSLSGTTTTANYPLISTTTAGLYANNTSITMNGGTLTATKFVGSLATNNLVPAITKTYASTSYYSTNDSWDNSSWYFMSAKPDSWYKTWKVKFKVRSYCPSYTNEDSTSWVEIYGRNNGITSYKIYNEFYDRGHYYINAYPLTKTGFDAGYGVAIGVSIRYANNYTNSAHYRTFIVDYYDCEGCTVTLLDTPVKWASWTGTGTTNYGGLSTFDAQNRGLRETGDDNSYDLLQMSNNYLTNGSQFRFAPNTIFGFDRAGNAQGFSLYSSEYTGSTVSINTARVYNTTGIDWTRGLYYKPNGTNHAKSANLDIHIRNAGTACDLRYTDNCVPSSAASTLGMLPRKPVYFRGVIKSDGLFYLAPISVTYNSATYQRVWTQDIPTTIETDGTYQYVYWFIGYPYYNGSYTNGQYQINLEAENKMYWYHNGRFEKYEENSNTANVLKSFATITDSTSHANALKTYFDANKTKIPRDKFLHFYDATSSNGAATFGYFLNGYDSNPYGGFFVAHYNNAYYVGIANGTYSQQQLLTSTNYNNYAPTKTGGGASGTWGINISGNAAKDSDGNAINTTYLKLSGGTMTGPLTATYITVNAQNTTNEGGEIKLNAAKSSFKNVVMDSYENYFRLHDGTNERFKVDMSTGNAQALGTFTATKVYNAVWNDYAEYRSYNDGETPYGKVVCENGDDSVSLSTKRLQPGAMICSDTFGHCMGEEENGIPIAVAGRVLAYPLEPREEYNFFIGQAVCSGPNGTVSIMTKDEVKEYPECIIGYISAVPKYEIWGSGNVKVDGRIWIKVK